MPAYAQPQPQIPSRFGSSDTQLPLDKQACECVRKSVLGSRITPRSLRASERTYHATAGHAHLCTVCVSSHAKPGHEAQIKITWMMPPRIHVSCVSVRTSRVSATKQGWLHDYAAGGVGRTALIHTRANGHSNVAQMAHTGWMVPLVHAHFQSSGLPPHLS